MRAKTHGQSILLLLDVIDCLNQHRIPYAIIGALAASFYGIVRASIDADAIVSIMTTQDASHLCRSLKAAGLMVEQRKGDEEDPVKGIISIIDQFQNKVDLLLGIQGMSSDTFQRIQKTDFQGASINMVGVEDFIAMKIFAGSPKDIQDVIGVLNVSAKTINLTLLRKLTRHYGQDCLLKLQKLLKEHSLK